MPKRSLDGGAIDELDKMVEHCLLVVRRLEIRLTHLRDKLPRKEHSHRSNEARLPPVKASAYLRKRYGLRYTVGTLTTMRSNGEGPPFHKHGAAVYYRVSELDAWAATASPTKRGQIAV